MALARRPHGGGPDAGPLMPKRSSARPRTAAGRQPAPAAARRAYPSREGRTAVSVYLPDDAHYTLTLFALERDSNLQRFGEEAWADFIAKHGLKIKKKPRRPSR